MTAPLSRGELLAVEAIVACRMPGHPLLARLEAVRKATPPTPNEEPQP